MYEKATQFCSDGIVYSSSTYGKCGATVYDKTTDFCNSGNVYSSSAYGSCGTTVYSKSTQFCYNNTKVYALCNSKTYDPSMWNCSNNKASASVSFSAYKSDSYGTSFEFSKSLSVPAGVKSVSMKMSNLKKHELLYSVDFQITIGGVSKSFSVVDKSWGTTEFTINATSATFSFSSPLAKPTAIVGKTTGGTTPFTDPFTGTMTFTYVP